MKLKKIASLALAGIMAVSMLAGCKDNPSSSTPTDPETPVVSNAAEYANYMLSGPQKNIFTFGSNADLDSNVKKVAENSDNLADGQIENTYGTLTVINEGTGSSAVKTVGEKLDDEFSNMNIITVADFDTAPSVLGNRVAIDVLGVSGKLDEEDAVKSVVKSWIASNGVSTTVFPASVANFNFEYKAEISALKVASRQHSDQSMWVVAIMVTQTATEA